MPTTEPSLSTLESTWKALRSPVSAVVDLLAPLSARDSLRRGALQHESAATSATAPLASTAIFLAGGGSNAATVPTASIRRADGEARLPRHDGRLAVDADGCRPWPSGLSPDGAAPAGIVRALLGRYFQPLPPLPRLPPANADDHSGICDRNDDGFAPEMHAFAGHSIREDVHYSSFSSSSSSSFDSSYDGSRLPVATRDYHRRVGAQRSEALLAPIDAAVAAGRLQPPVQQYMAAPGIVVSLAWPQHRLAVQVYNAEQLAPSPHLAVRPHLLPPGVRCGEMRWRDQQLRERDCTMVLKPWMQRRVDTRFLRPREQLHVRLLERHGWTVHTVQLYDENVEPLTAYQRLMKALPPSVVKRQSC